MLAVLGDVVSAVRRRVRAASWHEVSRAQYSEAFKSFGGSIGMHPTVIQLIEELADRSVKYIGLEKNAQLVAALPVWDRRYIVGTYEFLGGVEVGDKIDLGEGEIVLPICDGQLVQLPNTVGMLSEVHVGNVQGVHAMDSVSFMIARGHSTGEDRLSGKFLYNQRTQLRRFIEAGGKVSSVSEMSAAEVAAVYRKLHLLRWSRVPKGDAYLEKVFTALKDLLFGHVLFLDMNPVGVDLMYKHQTPSGLIAVGVNGGTDPSLKHLGLGSILHFLNGTALEKESIVLSAPLRCCYGKNDAPYKSLWCKEAAAYCA